MFHDRLLRSKGDGTFGTLEKLDQTVIVNVSAQVLGVREHLPSQLKMYF